MVTVHASRGAKPAQVTTGRRGYLANRASVALSSHSRKVAPRADTTVRACAHVAQSPAAVSTLTPRR